MRSNILLDQLYIIFITTLYFRINAAIFCHERNNLISMTYLLNWKIDWLVFNVQRAILQLCGTGRKNTGGNWGNHNFKYICYMYWETLYCKWQFKAMSCLFCDSWKSVHECLQHIFSTIFAPFLTSMEILCIEI